MRRKIDSRVNHSNGCFLIHQADPNIKQMNLWIPTSKDFLSIYQYLEQNRYLWVFTGAQFIKNFANYMKKNNLCLNYPLSFIEYSSQNILPEDKIVIENVFNTRLISNYACREVWSIAYECRCGHLHVNDKYLILDIVDDKDNIITEENRFGRVIITSTINTTMPLIKYSIGDIARINYNFKCECGNLSPIIELAPGRESDLIDGTNIYGNSLFRRVMRRIYFHEDLTIKNVRIVYQKLTRKFNVYVELENVKHALEVKKKFLEHTFEISPELRRYKFEFKYEFPFHSIPSAEKEQIFFKE